MTKVNSITFDLPSCFVLCQCWRLRFVDHRLSDIFRERSIKLIVILYVNSGKEERGEKRIRERETAQGMHAKQQCVKLSESDGQAKKEGREKIKQYLETSQQNNRKLRVIFKRIS